MTSPLHFILSRGAYVSLTLCALTACNTQPSSESLDTEDRFHEKSFSWNDPSGNPLLAKAAASRTRFESAEDLARAVMTLDDELKSPGVSDSLWKPIDYACDELALGLWNRYGTITVGDSVVLDERSLKTGCLYVGDSVGVGTSGLSKSAATYPTAVETDRQYPYKMIGESWSEFTVALYKSTGGETQFKKYRDKFGFSGWYDTDATRIGIRIRLMDCTASLSPRVCIARDSHSDWYSNDDYVSKRINASVGSSYYGVVPDKGVALLKYSVAVVSYHSVDHAGLQFRATSSSGLTSTTVAYGLPDFGDFVTW